MAPDGPKMAQDGPKMASGWLQDGLRMAHDGPRNAQRDLRSSNLSDVHNTLCFTLLYAHRLTLEILSHDGRSLGHHAPP